MQRNKKYTFHFIFLLCTLLITSVTAWSQNDTSVTRYKIPSQTSSLGGQVISPLFLQKPSNIQQSVEYDPETNSYEIAEKVGSLNYRPPMIMSMEEYQLYRARKNKNDYWRQKATADGGDQPGFMKSFNFGGETFDKVFGTNSINIVPQGNAEIILGYKISKSDNPQIAEEFQRNGSLVFEQKIQMNVNGSIGDKMELGINYNTDATFDFENKTKLEYTGKEDEIIKKIEAGDVSLPLSGSLINGSQSLFGLKTELQFGNLTVTNVFSHQKGESQVITVEGGAQLTDFEVEADDYEEDKHFFLGHFFKEKYAENYEKMRTDGRSGLNITKIEVWVTSRKGSDAVDRNIAAFMDLGEGLRNNINYIDSDPDNLITVNNPLLNESPPTDNDQNTLYTKLDLDVLNDFNNLVKNLADDDRYKDLRSGVDYEKLRQARLLQSNEYSYNAQLGYLSLNFPLQDDDILAVAYTYDYNGEPHTVGEFASTSGKVGENTLVVKLLKGSRVSPKYTNWDLMMRNVYSLGAYSVNKEDFMFNIYYRSDATGNPTTRIDEGAIANQRLLTVLELDKLDYFGKVSNNGDGMFDFINGVTINPRNGRIYFPTTEPFGKDLYDKIAGKNDAYASIADKYVFTELYDSTKTRAELVSSKNKFLFKGSYKSAVGSEIQLNAMNIPRGSVKVTAGGIMLEEGAQYSVDYALGRVTILDEGLLESGTPLKISLESNSLFNFQTKTFVGTNLNYRINDNFNLGATWIHLTEKPLTQKVNIGDEPVSNTIWGLNGSYRTESPWLTNAVDKYIPFIETKEKSIIDINAEFAQLIPGQPKIIGRNGIAYIDDFESSETELELKNFAEWRIASVPQHNPLFPGGDIPTGNLASGFNRARLSWYHISDDFYEDSPIRYNSTDNKEHDHRWRRVMREEIFPGRDQNAAEIATIQTLDLTFYPGERGPYNYVTDDSSTTVAGTTFSPAIDHISLNNPEERWGGIMRDLIITDFDKSNIEYIKFWVMDPYYDDNRKELGNAKLIIHLGDVSEDVLRDGRMSFEYGLPADGVYTKGVIDSTEWGYVPTNSVPSTAFDEQKENRFNQDVGLDGMPNDKESIFFQNTDSAYSYTDFIKSKTDADDNYDFSSDDFYHFLDNRYNANSNVLERYKYYNGMDKNTPTDAQSSNKNVRANYIRPDEEDLNEDRTLNETEAYFQYEIDLNSETYKNSKYIIDTREYTAEGHGDKINWYQYKIPISEFTDNPGNIEDFTSIKFIRVMLKGFKEPITLRFGSLELVRSEWRKYKLDMRTGTGGFVKPAEESGFEISSINIEENRSKYATPPGIDRTVDPYNPQVVQEDEQSMVLTVQGLEDDDARAAYKRMSLDMRNYKKLKLDVHAEEFEGQPLDDQDLSVFIRLGSDYNENYYEYEYPLHVTDEQVNIPLNTTDADEATKQILWKNHIIIQLQDLVDLKLERNRLQVETPFYVTRTRPYVKDKVIDVNISNSSDVKKTVRTTVKGNPNLADVRVLMIGVRNPGNSAPSGRIAPWQNDGLPKSGVIWVNELRLTDFNNKGGWAATARVQTKLADFATISVAGNTSTAGFGSIDQKVDERAKEDVKQYDVSTNVELGKFFSEKARVSIPMHVGYSDRVVTPEYYPFDPDVPYQTAVKNTKDEDFAREIAEDRTTRKSINFTNVKVNQRSEKLPPLSPSNFSLSTGFSRNEHHDINYERNTNINYKAGLSYNYTIRSKPVRPFAKSKALRSNYLRIIRDFNFSYLPSQISFNTNIDRRYSEMQLRDLETSLLVLNGELSKKTLTELYNTDENTASKDFSWYRKYNVNWNLSRSLKIDYSATNHSYIEEHAGPYDHFTSTFDRQEKISWYDKVGKSMSNGGSGLNFKQNVNASYTIPVNKLPLLNWVSSNARYSASYDWKRDINGKYGNTINNSSQMQLNNTFNLKNLYDKVNYLKSLDQNRRFQNTEKRTKEVRYVKDGTLIRANVPKRITHKLKTEEIEIQVFNNNNQLIKCNLEIVDENRINITSAEEIAGARIVVTGIVEKGENPLIFITENVVRTAIGLKRLSVSYQYGGGSQIQGYSPYTQFFGIDSRQGNAPGSDYLFGFNNISFNQDDELSYIARNTISKFADNNWLTSSAEDTSFSNRYGFTINKTLQVKGSYEPFQWLKADVSLEHKETKNMGGVFAKNNDVIEWDWIADNVPTPTFGGNYSMSVISIGTAFQTMFSDDPENDSKAYIDFLKLINKLPGEFSNSMRTGEYNNVYQAIVSQGNDSVQTPGYNKYSQQVLISSFLASYTTYTQNNVPTTALPVLGGGSNYYPLPNWRVTFTGLNKIDFINDNFKSVNISHGYRSRYSVSNFTQHEQYIEPEIWQGINRPDLAYRSEGDLTVIPEFDITGVTISEQFSPLININVTFKNEFITKFEIKNSRNLALSLINTQLTESLDNTFVLGFGYSFKELPLEINGKSYNSDLKIKADFSVRSNRTIIREIDKEFNGVNTKAGDRTFAFSLAADYQFSDAVNSRAYFDYNDKDPFAAVNAYRNRDAEFGIAITFMLTQ